MAGKDLWVLACLLVGLSKFFLEFGRVQIILIIFCQHTFSGTIFSGTEFNFGIRCSNGEIKYHDVLL